MADLGYVLDYLQRLEQNNEREWFKRHRADYDRARAEFEAFIEDLIDGVRPHDDMGPLQAKDTLMRIYRDIRFSKDKTPYNGHMAASIRPGGRKSNRLGYYIHLKPGNNSYIGGGLYQAPSDWIKRLRATFAEDAAPFKQIINDSAFHAAFGELSGDRVKTAPRGYSKDHPEIALLRMKDFLAGRSFSDSEVRADDFGRRVVDHFVLLKPFVRYLEQAARDG